MLVRSFGPWESPGEDNPDALRALAARSGVGDSATVPAGDLELRLRALYDARDPGVPAPLQLLMRLQQDQN